MLIGNGLLSSESGPGTVRVTAVPANGSGSNTGQPYRGYQTQGVKQTWNMHRYNNRHPGPIPAPPAGGDRAGWTDRQRRRRVDTELRADCQSSRARNRIGRNGVRAPAFMELAVAKQLASLGARSGKRCCCSKAAISLRSCRGAARSLRSFRESEIARFSKLYEDLLERLFADIADSWRGS